MIRYTRLFLLAAVMAGAQGDDAAAAVDKRDILARAAQAYYSLRLHDATGFQCSLTPNWHLLLEGERQQDPQGADKAEGLLSQLQFTVTMAADGSVSLTHNDLAGQNQQMTDALKQIYGGMEEMTSGFFDTWRGFMWLRPFPAPDSDYQLDPDGTGYRISYKDGNADIAAAFDGDFAINSLHVTTPQFDSTVEPRFDRTPSGLVMTGYEADYNSAKPQEATVLHVKIDNQVVGDAVLPQTLAMSGTYGGSPFSIVLTFSACHLGSSG